MTFRLGALLCLSGLAACSHNTNQTANDPSYVDQSTESTMRPASLENRPTATPPNGASTDARAALDADTKRTKSDELDSKRDTPPAATPSAPADVPAEPTQASVAPDNNTISPDNTKVNKRDAQSTALTPMDQNNNQADLKITQQIRQALMADGSLSFTAKNVKIITQNGKVTLRGPVNSAEERSAIEAAARKVAGAAQVDNQLEVKK
jgi:hyperosmotically inducible protein